MKITKLLLPLAAAAALAAGCANPSPTSCVSPVSEDTPLPAPRFSTNYMDPSVSPGSNFYLYANGAWMRDNPIPADKPSWSAFSELRERNWQLIHDILYSTIADCDAPPPPRHSPLGEVAAFYASAIDTARLEQLGFSPLRDDFARINALKTTAQLAQLLAEFQNEGVSAMFGAGVSPDAKNSSVYAFEMGQGGLMLPDRDYYLSDGFADKRTAYVAHIAKMFVLTGEPAAQAKAEADKILDLETELAKACKPRAELRDPIANYHKFTVADAAAKFPNFPLREFLRAEGLGSLRDIIIDQPDFFDALNGLLARRPMEDWACYLRWHVLHDSAPFLHDAAEQESFAFYGKILSDQPEQEPRWQRAARFIDTHIGEALGQLYVEKNFPPEARARANELVENIKSVFHDHLEKVPWMTPETRAKALAKFTRFTQKIGAPQKFRDYSSIDLRPDDYLGNIRRSAQFESKRELARVGKPVDRSEWEMTPQTVNAYFSPDMNQIVFPAGILQAPFFDIAMDDAVNYGGIGVVIGHEITHGYDDQGRKFDGDGNLNNWWTTNDAQAFEARAQLVVEQYSAYEPLPGAHINGRLTLGENLADLGGVTIAYDALERDLAQHPERRKVIDGFTPEQRFFLSFAQIWRTKWRESEQRLRLVTDVHSPGQFRAIGPESNLQQFFDAFNIRQGDPMWRPPAERAIVW